MDVFTALLTSQLPTENKLFGRFARDIFGRFTPPVGGLFTLV
jgi:hypothetical protein